MPRGRVGDIFAYPEHGLSPKKVCGKLSNSFPARYPWNIHRKVVGKLSNRLRIRGAKKPLVFQTAECDLNREVVA